MKGYVFSSNDSYFCRVPRFLRLSYAVAVLSGFVALVTGANSAQPNTPILTSFPVNVTQFAVDPVRPRIYGTDYGTDNVYVFNTSTLTMEATIPVIGHPRGVAISSDNSRLFVANDRDVGVSNPDYIISVIDLETLVKLPALHVPYSPYDLEDGLDGRLYASLNFGVEIANVFQVDDLTGAFQGWVGIGKLSFSPHLEISPDRTILYGGTSFPTNANLVKFDVSTPNPTILQTLDAGDDQITLSHDGTFICYAAGVELNNHFPAGALHAEDLSVKGTFPYDSFYGLQIPIALSPDDTVAYQLDAELNINPGYPTALSIHLRSTTTFRNLDTIIVDNNLNSSLPLAMVTDNTGHYLFVPTPNETVVYDVTPRIETAAQVIGLAGSPFNYQTPVTFDATSFSASSLPPGLQIDNTGLITGTPTTPGIFDTAITASRGTFHTSQTLNFQIDGTRLKNISTRAFVRPDEKTLIGGFIIEGSVPKKVVVRILGPSLTGLGLAPYGNPAFRLYGSDGLEIAYNNDWGFTDDQDLAALIATGLAPADPTESALITTLDPGAYTAVVEPGGGGLPADGTALFEVYDVDENSLSTLANVSSRAAFYPNIGAEIGGIIVRGPGSDRVLIRGIGPSLAAQGVSDPMADPMLELHDNQGTLIESNDNWRDSQESEIAATDLAPADDLESAILINLPEGEFTAVLQTSTISYGVCLVEAYHLP